MTLSTNGGMAVATNSMRPTFAAAHASICQSLPGFEMVDKYPVRSPLAVADFLAPIVQGRKFTEIGTRNGDIMGCLHHFASQVTAIELDVNYCKKLRARGFTVLCKAVESVTASEMPDSDVYFWWPMWSPKQNEAWLRLLLNIHAKTGKRAAAYIAHDTHWKPDMDTLRRLAPYYGATNVTRIFFDEDTAPANAQSPAGNPEFGRPGHWGVFHLARFELGPHVSLPPPHSSRGSVLPVERRRSSSRPAEAPWMSGYCAVTESTEDISNACLTHDQGSVPLGPHLGIHTREDCVRFCFQKCKRCRYVSFSSEFGDCSWFHRCDMSALFTTLNGAKMPFESRPVLTRRQQQNSQSNASTTA